MRAARSAGAASMLAGLVLAGCTLRGDRPRPEASPSPRAGGVLRVALLEPATLDPSRASDADRPGRSPELLVVAQMCDPLVAVDPASGALRPGAAESWAVSPDARKVTLRLRPGLRFHNGREVAARDYVYSLSRFVSPDAGSAQHFFLEKVVGYREVRERRSAELAGVKAPDPRTLEIELTEPFAELPAVLAHPAAGAAVPQEEAGRGAEAFGQRPSCMGPYMLAAPRRQGEDIRLVRTAPFRRIAVQTGGGLVDEIVFKVVPDLESSLRLLQRGLVEVAQIPENRLAAAASREVAVEGRSNGLLSYVGFPNRRPPFDRAEFRRALSLGIDRRGIVESILGGSRQIPAGFLPPAAGPVAELSACPGAMRSTADAAEARAALQAAGVDPAATKLTIRFNDGASGHQAWLERVAEQWRGGLGIESTLEAAEFRRYLDVLAAGSADGPFRLAWPVAYPSPEALFAPVFLTGSADNYAGFANPAFDDAVRRARATPEEPERRRLYAEAAAVLCREVPVAPVWFGMNHYGFSRSLAAAGRHRLDVFGGPLLRELGMTS